jgi:hypothetical protein
MFKISKNQTFTRSVKIFTPVDDGFREEALKTTFALLPVDEVRKFNLGKPEETDAFLERAVVKFSELTGDDDKPTPCNAEIRAWLLKQPHVRQGLCLDYFEAVANNGPKTGN